MRVSIQLFPDFILKNDKENNFKDNDKFCVENLYKITIRIEDNVNV